jgi:hypothetical protein
MITGRLGGRRSRHDAVRHGMPANDLCAAEGGEARILPIGVVVTNDESDAADRRVEDFDVGVSWSEDLLILRVEADLPVFADDAFGAE